MYSLQQTHYVQRATGCSSPKHCRQPTYVTPMQLYQAARVFSGVILKSEATWLIHAVRSSGSSRTKVVIKVSAGFVTAAGVATGTGNGCKVQLFAKCSLLICLW